MELFELLHASGLKEGIVEKTLRNWGPDEFNTFYEAINEIIKLEPSFSEKAKFSFTASTQLSGGESPCAGFECRAHNLDLLSRNAVLYADKVYIQNWFGWHHVFESIYEFDIESLTNSVQLLYTIKPLIESGYIGICKSTHHFCPECYSRLVEDRFLTWQNKVDTIREYLERRYTKEVNFFLEMEEDKPVIRAEGPTELLDHPMNIYFDHDIPEQLTAMCRPNKSIPLKENEVLETGAADSLIYSIIYDIQHQNYYGKIYDTHFLTGSELDLKALSAIKNEKDRLKSELILQNLSHAVPFIADATLVDLIRLRQNEGEAFEVYRDALNNLIASLDETDPKKIQQALGDVIQPEIHKMNQTIKNSKKLIWTDINKDFLVGGLFVGISYYGGILPPDIGGIVSALGGINFVSKIGTNVAKLFNDPPTVTDNPYYFLWKLDDQVKAVG